MFVFVIEYFTRVFLSMSISMGVWMVYKTAGGVYYGAKWLSGAAAPQKITEIELAELHSEPVVVLTEQEYRSLLGNQEHLKLIEQKLEKIEENILH
jgi:hypothetical protein